MWEIHAKNRPVLFRLLDLMEIGAASQDESLINALGFVVQHRHTRRDFLPIGIDLSFASERWRNYVITRENKSLVIDRRALEVCVFWHVAEELRSGNIYVKDSQDYNDPRAQLLDTKTRH